MQHLVSSLSVSGRPVHRLREYMSYRFAERLRLSARRGCVVSSTPLPYFAPEKDPVPIVQEAGWAPVWAGAENLATNGNRSPDHPARTCGFAAS